MPVNLLRIEKLCISLHLLLVIRLPLLPHCTVTRPASLRFLLFLFCFFCCCATVQSPDLPGLVRRLLLLGAIWQPDEHNCACLLTHPSLLESWKQQHLINLATLAVPGSSYGAAAAAGSSRCSGAERRGEQADGGSNDNNSSSSALQPWQWVDALWLLLVASLPPCHRQTAAALSQQVDDAMLCHSKMLSELGAQQVADLLGESPLSDLSNKVQKPAELSGTPSRHSLAAEAGGLLSYCTAALSCSAARRCAPGC